MSTMQEFYNNLVSAFAARDPYFAPLSNLTRASAAHVAILDLGWQYW